MWDADVHPLKLARAKEILEGIITGGDGSTDNSDGVAWMPEWIAPIRKWSSEITVCASRTLSIALKFPLPTKTQCSFQITIESTVKSEVMLCYSTGGESIVGHDLMDDRVLKWYRGQANLNIVPPNILAWTIIFFVKQLGGSIRHKFSGWARCDNWLFLKEQHRFPGFQRMSKASTYSTDKGWVVVQLREYSTTLELPGSHYLSHLLNTFKDDLAARTIESQFSQRGQSLLDNARRFVNSLAGGSCRGVWLLCPDETPKLFTSSGILRQIRQDASLQDKLAFKIDSTKVEKEFDTSNVQNSTKVAKATKELDSTKVVNASGYDDNL